ncbi:hypothetical protein [Streptomyces xantholiticus]|uniref:hypothetical protein n=1 Tax=Streptomyces xantholiticus TaxID=68285 RepID=UPI001677B26C|nr:hypothetical protein [Streptomyces xantholiticus]GGW41214.1 hypothetical protein GCM10010381_27580 [Streptomyces xantholiticus]
MTQELTKGQATVLIAATLPMIAAGAFGGWGTYTNIVSEFGRAATALGVVAAGEGVTLVLALVMVGLTMLGQPAPAPVRVGLWLAPIGAAVTGLVVADDVTEGVVYAITPMAMSAAAEGLGLLARRVVVYRTGVDMEAQRSNAATVRRLAYLTARAAQHPHDWTRKRSQLAAWRLMARVGLGDVQLGSDLVTVQRDRLTEGADKALAAMLGLPAPALIANTEQPPEQLAPAAPNTASTPPNVTREQIADHAATSPNTDRPAPTIAELAREQVAITPDNRTAVNLILAVRPDADRESVAAAVRRERRKGNGGYN